MSTEGAKSTAIQGVYAITPTEDSSWKWDDIVDSSQAVLDAGVRVLQMRQKNLGVLEYAKRAERLGRLCERYQATLILNDAPALPEISSWLGVKGVHLGKDDLSVDVARSLWGDDFLIGASCYNQLLLAEQAFAAGADHIAFGAVYQSATKPNAVQAPLALFERAKPLEIPRVAIGGIQIDCLSELVRAGADAVAVVSALFGDQPDAHQTNKRAAQWVDAWTQVNTETE